MYGEGKKMKKIYFASDIDGTLSMEGKPLNIEQRILLKKMHNSGIHIIFATGRDYKKLHEVLEKLDFEYAAICCNGAEIYDSLGNLKFYNILYNRHKSIIIKPNTYNTLLNVIRTE